MYPKFYKELEEAGHELVRDKEGNIDIYYLDIDYHNGPGCVKCGDRWCEHCQPKIEKCKKEKTECEIHLE